MAQEPQPATAGTASAAGWAYFAGLLLLLIGIFHAITGLVAIFKDQLFLVSEQTLLILDYRSWGWMHLILGGLLIIASFSLMAGNIFGRVVGVIFATLSAIINFAFIYAFPLWSILTIFLDVLIVYGILVHSSGRRHLEPPQSQSAPPNK